MYGTFNIVMVYLTNLLRYSGWSFTKEAVAIGTYPSTKIGLKFTCFIFMNIDVSTIT